MLVVGLSDSELSIGFGDHDNIAPVLDGRKLAVISLSLSSIVLSSLLLAICVLLGAVGQGLSSCPNVDQPVPNPEPYDA